MRRRFVNGGQYYFGPDGNVVYAAPPCIDFGEEEDMDDQPQPAAKTRKKSSKVRGAVRAYTLDECLDGRFAILCRTRHDLDVAASFINPQSPRPITWYEHEGQTCINTLNGRPNNRQFYEEHGFEIIEIFQLKAVS